MRNVHTHVQEIHACITLHQILTIRKLVVILILILLKFQWDPVEIGIYVAAVPCHLDERRESRRKNGIVCYGLIQIPPERVNTCPIILTA